MNKPYLGDQLGRDEGKDEDVEFAPKGEEPLLNCWLEVECDTPDGSETIFYMLVEGAYVRDHLFVDFVEGGHYYRYGWTPEGQIWLEDIMSIVDQVCTGVHEIHERYRMKYLGWNYERAHESACKIERIVRGLFLEPEVVIPPAEDIAEILALEGSGKSCEGRLKELVKEHANLSEEANRQANNAEGSREG